MNESTNMDGVEKLSLIVHSPDIGKIHYALVLAAGAAAINKPVTMFFTMGASTVLSKNNGDVAPWHSMPANGFANGLEMDNSLKQRAMADFQTLFQACIDLGVRFMVCEMGLLFAKIEQTDLRDDINIEITGVVTFLNDASKDGSIIFI
ncbi:MAG: DsrE/DsrF/DrsH-like family protein [Rhodospirillaceae bacterium]|nr:DsrE/DsrF/DrsH-like family protein [Rhodospirillaceae bacterium]